MHYTALTDLEQVKFIVFTLLFTLLFLLKHAKESCKNLNK